MAVTWSIASGQVWLLFTGLAVHWLGDVADGIVARGRREETRAGAVLDIVCDRLCISLYYVSYGHLHHAMLVPIAIFLFQFMVLDAHLSLTFLNWPLNSLNYYGLVDWTIYVWNWSTPGKALNSGALVALMLTTHSPAACTGLALAIMTVKAVSLTRVHRAGVPSPVGCAAPALRVTARARRQWDGRGEDGHHLPTSEAEPRETAVDSSQRGRVGQA